MPRLASPGTRYCPPEVALSQRSPLFTFPEETQRQIHPQPGGPTPLAKLMSACGSFSPLVVVVETGGGDVIGTYLSHPWSERFQHPAGAYFGNADCFIWRYKNKAKPAKGTGTGTDKNRGKVNDKVNDTGKSMGGGDGGGGAAKHARLELWKPAVTRNNMPASTLYMSATDTSLRIGGGGSGPAIELRHTLADGFSFESATFNNEPLVGKGGADTGHSFTAAKVLVYGFGPEARERSTHTHTHTHTHTTFI